ncbi:MAG: SUF system NifU family Fe-S cluster assembly protein [Ruminiclostridium sp.]|nr:SUF system NifU family Fe-S cluster assembly protein [Ruminiclostridium sp.]
MENSFYSEILTDHNMHPVHKHELSGCTCSRDGINQSCGDEITLKLRIDNGVIADGSFTGSGCAVSQASADIMLDLIIGRSVDEASKLHELFMRMIHGEADEAELDELDEAAALRDISRMPARVKCAVLGWRTMKEMIGSADDKI